MPGILFWASVVLVAVGFVLLSRRRGTVAWPALLGLVAFAALGAVAVRGIAWWPGVAVVTLAGLAAPAVALRAAPPPTQHGSPLNALVGAAIILAGVAVLPSWRSLDPDLGAPAGLLALRPARRHRGAPRRRGRGRPGLEPATVGILVRARGPGRVLRLSTRGSS